MDADPSTNGDQSITDEGLVCPKIDDAGQHGDSNLPSNDLHINDAGHGGPKIDDEGHQLVVDGTSDDLKINDADHHGPKIDDEGHRNTSVSALSDVSQDSMSEDGLIDEGHSFALVIDTDAVDADDDESDGGMEVGNQASKREHLDGSASDSSDGSLRHCKKGKAIGDALSRLLTEASATPVPDDDKRSPDLILETPVDPDPVDKLSWYVDTDCPLTKKTPIVKPSVKINTASQSSSSGLEMFLPQKTQPKPVVGTHCRTRSQSRGDPAE